MSLKYWEPIVPNSLQVCFIKITADDKWKHELTLLFVCLLLLLFLTKRLDRSTVPDVHTSASVYDSACAVMKIIWV